MALQSLFSPRGPQLVHDIINKGDKLVVWKLDRFASNMLDLSKIVKTIDDKSASLEILDQNIDTSTASEQAFLQMLGVFGDFENSKIHLVAKKIKSQNGYLDW